MSPRAACRLTQLGFAPVYDYTLGKADWIAAGLPTGRAGQPSRRVLDALRRDVPTCAPDAPAGPALQQARAQGWDRCVVIAGQRTVVGMLRADRTSVGEQALAAVVMQPGPTTVRAHEDLDVTRQRMNEHHVAHLLVTTPDGTLIGVVDAADS
ncbi:MAG TPA: CBS domain-containing protein [Streptosporangiaceae bacterium]|nr:CBS domain-containing protein [Streptosporangiaceae bacterium]